MNADLMVTTRPAPLASRRLRLLAAGGCLSLAACASGESIINAGNDATTTTVTTVATQATPGSGGSQPAGPTTIQLFPSADTPAGGSAEETVAATTPTPAGPTTIQLFPSNESSGFASGLASSPIDYAPCPVDALADADGPVTVEFWHAMQSAPGEMLQTLVEQFNAEHAGEIVVELQNQNGYEELIDKYFQSSVSSRPNLVQMPEYMLQQMADANTVVSATACIQAEGYDTTPFLPRALVAYQTGGVQWAMPFNVSSPVVYYNKAIFEEAGLDPDVPPITLEQLREFSEQIVESGAATYGIALDSGINSGGGWFLEQWLSRAGLPYTDNDNGRSARATRVLFDTPEAAEMLTFAQSLVEDNLAVYVGEDPRGIDGLLRMADPEQPAAMTIATSGALGGVLDFVAGGAIAGVTADQIGVGPMPGPTDVPSAIIGGASLYIVRDQGDPEAAAAWEFVKFVSSAESQSLWADGSGYAPVRSDAIELDPLAARYEADPRYRVAYDQVTFGADDSSALGPVLGPLREIRGVTATMMADIYSGDDVQDALTATAQQADLMIIDYNNRNQ